MSDEFKAGDTLGYAAEAGTEPTHARYDPVIGSEVSGYRVTNRLGAGGMGVVYEGEQPVIGKRVAIKVLRHEVADNPDVVQRLVAEARAVNQVGHRGIIDVFGFGQLPDGRQCIVMEYLSGEPLETVLRGYELRHTTIPLIDGLTILEEVLSALAAAHSAGVIHRDLKPSNIFLCQQRDGARFVKLLDFGIAKLGVLGNSTPASRASVMMGTPAYMAPEQANGGAVTAAMDLYALGVLAFELLTGRQPFMRDSVMGMLMAHASEAPPRVSEFNPQVPPVLDELVAHLMAKKPEDRPASAEAVRLEVARLRASMAGASSTPLSLTVFANPFDPGSPPRPSRPSLPAIPAIAAADAPPAPPANATVSMRAMPTAASEAPPAAPTHATGSMRTTPPAASEAESPGRVVEPEAPPQRVIGPVIAAAAVVVMLVGGGLFLSRSSPRVEEAAPGAETTPATAVVDPKPAEAVAEAKPATAVVDPKPLAPVAEVKPDTAVVDPKPLAPVAEAKPVNSVVDPKPAAPVAEAKPVNSAVDPKPTAPVAEAKPVNSAVDPKPLAPVAGAKSGAPPANTRPAAPAAPEKSAVSGAGARPSAPNNAEASAGVSASMRARVSRIEANLARAEKGGEDVSLFRRTMAKVKARLASPGLGATDLEDLDVTLSRLDQETSSL